MAYSTEADLLELVDQSTLVRLTQDDENLSTVDSDVVTRAIEDADATIDGYVSNRYAVPLTPVPKLVRRLSTVIARYHLFDRRGLDESGPDKSVVDAYHAALKMLERISAGQVTLGVAPPEPQSATTITSADRVFSRTSLEDW